MMLPAQWQRAFARQAFADFRLWAWFQTVPSSYAEDCHQLMLLQMACEKLCKAHLIAQGVDPATLQTSHGFVSGPLPVILRQQFLDEGGTEHRLKQFRSGFRQIAQEIEVLSPAIDRDGRRPDNCEYPWAHGENVHSPLDHAFAALDLIRAPSGRTILKLIEGAIGRLL